MLRITCISSITCVYIGCFRSSLWNCRLRCYFRMKVRQKVSKEWHRVDKCPGFRHFICQPYTTLGNYINVKHRQFLRIIDWLLLECRFGRVGFWVDRVESGQVAENLNGSGWVGLFSKWTGLGPVWDQCSAFLHNFFVSLSVNQCLSGMSFIYVKLLAVPIT